MANSSDDALVLVMDIEAGSAVDDAQAVMFSVTVEGEAGLRTVQMDRCALRKGGIMQAYIAGTPILLSLILLAP